LRNIHLDFDFITPFREIHANRLQALAAWRNGHRVRLQNLRSRVRTPPGCKVFRTNALQCCCQNLTCMRCHCVYLRQINALTNRLQFDINETPPVRRVHMYICTYVCTYENFDGNHLATALGRLTRLVQLSAICFFVHFALADRTLGRHCIQRRKEELQTRGLCRKIFLTKEMQLLRIFNSVFF
jgi:hypothetical protein